MPGAELFACTEIICNFVGVFKINQVLTISLNEKEYNSLSVRNAGAWYG